MLRRQNVAFVVVLLVGAFLSLSGGASPSLKVRRQAVSSLSSSSTGRRRQGRRRLLLEVGRGGGTTSTPPPSKKQGPIMRAVGWTAAETVLLYTALLWAAMAGERRLELTLIAVVVYGSSAIADALLATAAAALSAPVRQILLPTQTPDQKWYDALPKPKWNPPTWVFPVAWLLVSKPTQVLALARLRGGKLTPLARLAYSAHLALGDTWNRLFFGERDVDLGVAVIFTFVATLALAAALFATIDPVAGALLLPTLAWVSVAASLNLRISQLVALSEEKNKADDAPRRNHKRRR